MRRSGHAAAVLVLVLSGLTLAAAPAQAAAPPDAPVCNSACDGLDPATSTGDRVTATTDLFGRTFAVHVDSGEQMAWASVDGAQGGDEVWLDRSFDAGATWTGPLGRTATPAGGRDRRTGMYNVDDWAARGVGALRACGKAGDRPEVVCTSWTRTRWNAGDRRTAAATALMMRFDRTTGRFDGDAWWTGANALTSLVDLGEKTGLGSYDYAIAETYDKNVGAMEGQFRNDYLDDTGWWGVAWVRAYDRTGDRRYLDTARADAEHMHDYWDDTCGGGVWWREQRDSKNAISTSLYVQLNAMLAQRLGGDATYRDRAQAGWDWVQRTGMVGGDGLVEDGVDLGTCRTNGGTTWTYNQGVLVDALVQLHAVTGQGSQLTAARRTADAMVEHLSPGGVLRDPGEDDSCSSDGASFKGAAVRGLGKLNEVTGGAYDGYLRRNADAAHADDRDGLDQYGRHWAGPRTGSAHACQHSALDLLTAAP